MSEEQDSRKKDELEEKLKQRSVQAMKKEGRRLKFLPNPTGKKGLLSVVALIVLGLIIVGLLLATSKKKGTSPSPTTNTGSSSTAQVDSQGHNNSSGYSPSGPADFSGASLSLGYKVPTLAKTENIQIGIGQKADLQNGYAFKVVSLDRDWRPASEYTYRQVAESGSEIVRVNLIVGNNTQGSLDISYKGLDFYLDDPESSPKLNPERFTEDIYSPKDGQTLPAGQTRNISLHFKVKRGSSNLSLVRAQQLNQPSAKVKEGQEKNPTLSLRVNLF